MYTEKIHNLAYRLEDFTKERTAAQVLVSCSVRKDFVWKQGDSDSVSHKVYGTTLPTYRLALVSMNAMKTPCRWHSLIRGSRK